MRYQVGASCSVSVGSFPCCFMTLISLKKKENSYEDNSPRNSVSSNFSILPSHLLKFEKIYVNFQCIFITNYFSIFETFSEVDP